METIIPSDVILLFQICLIINDMISLDVLVLVLVLVLGFRQLSLSDFNF